MKDLKQWVLWRFGKPDPKTGKRPKITHHVSGKYQTDPVDPKNFVTYKEAKAVEKNFDGIGFSLVKDDGYIIVDLDNCFKKKKKLKPWVYDLMNEIGDCSTIDISPSGNGVHIIMKGKLPSKHKVTPQWKDEKLEVYSENRFITMPENWMSGGYDQIGKINKKFLKKLTKKVKKDETSSLSVNSGKSVKDIVKHLKKVNYWPLSLNDEDFYGQGEDEWKSGGDRAFLMAIGKAIGVPDCELAEAVYLKSNVVREKVVKRGLQYHIQRIFLEQMEWSYQNFAVHGDLIVEKPRSRELVIAEVVETLDSLLEAKAPLDEVMEKVAALGDPMKREEYLIQVKAAYPVTIGELRNMLKIKMNALVKPQFPDWDVNMLGGVTYLTTYANLQQLVKNKVRLDHHYDVILKDTVTGWRPGGGEENHILGKLRSHVLSEAVKHGLPKGIIEDHYDMIMKSNERNPLMEVIESVEWDGKDRIKELEKRINSDTGTKKYRRTILKRWLIQAIAAWDGCVRTPNKRARPKYEYILTLEGGQGVNKTTLFSELMPGKMNRYLDTGVFLKPTDRDSVKQVTSFGMCELGEIDATFKKADIAEIKAFLSAEYDTYRAAYARDDERHPRRTVFCASVNGTRFLNDPTGNRRFLVLHLTKSMNFRGFNFGQLWAQILELYLEGEKWWIERGEETWDIQQKVNSNATDGGAVFDALIEFNARLNLCDENSTKHRVSATKIWENLMGHRPNKLERSHFISALEDQGLLCNHNGVGLPVDFNLKSV